MQKLTQASRLVSSKSAFLHAGTSRPPTFVDNPLYLYLSMSDWCEHEGFPGFANWLRVQAREEPVHGAHILDYALERGARPRLETVPAPPETFRDLLDIFEQALRHEEQMIAGIATMLYALDTELAARVFADPFAANN